MSGVFDLQDTISLYIEVASKRSQFILMLTLRFHEIKLLHMHVPDHWTHVSESYCTDLSLIEN